MENIVYEYCLIRYVPDIEREEFINIGLLMMSKRHRWLNSRINIDKDRILAVCKDSDLELLDKQSRIFLDVSVPFADIAPEERFRWLAAAKSAIIQTSPTHSGIILAGVSDSPAQLLQDKFNSLFSRLVSKYKAPFL